MNKMMLKDTKDLLDNIEITDIATQCKLLKDKEAKEAKKKQVKEEKRLYIESIIKKSRIKK